VRILTTPLVLLAVCASAADTVAAEPSRDTATPITTQRAHEAAHATALDKPRSGWAGLPIVTYAPETRLGLGAFGAHFFRIGDGTARTRPSSLALVGLYTLRSQLIAELIPELYWDSDHAHIWSKLDYRIYPNQLWAIGPNAPDSSKETYTENRVRWQGRIGHTLRGPLFLYGHFDLMQMELSHAEEGGLLARGALPGARGGRTMILGAALTWDTRDHALVPHGGAYYDLLLASAQPAFGSKYRFTTLTCDLRNYFPVTRTHTLVTNLVLTIQDGDAPFYQLPKLGGSQLLRGYFDGRYRDNTLALVQAEYRLPLFWRFGAVVFGGLGAVSHTLVELRPDRPEWSVGTGLRILLNRDEQLNLRTDLGVGRNTYGVYVSAGEVF
jgi:hypothetical protein